MKKILFFSFAFCVLIFAPVSAQEDMQLTNLSKQIIEAKTSEDLYRHFEELKNIYFKDNKYNEFVEFLASLSGKKKVLTPFTDYYIALGRYNQLKYLEEKQNWDEYFANINAFREEISSRALKAIAALNKEEQLYIYARLLLWQYHSDQQDAFHEEALADLMGSVSEYAKAVAGDIQTVKVVADKLFSYGEKLKAKELYKAYVQKLASAGASDEDLSVIAAGFYKEGNLELAESVYDIYISRVIADKEKALPFLINIARDFSYKDSGPKDEAYAEAIFKKIEGLAGKEAFGEESVHLRAFNLEKIKEYIKAKDYYEELIKRFPSGMYFKRASYKAGIIYLYVARDIESARGCFEALKENADAYGLASLYQLGLISQWQGDAAKAKEYYDALIEKVKAGAFPENAVLAQERLREIEEAKPIEYNLKTFLDVCLKEEYAAFDATKADLRASIYGAKANQEINIAATVSLPQTGCLEVQLQYLWSGDLGQVKPLFSDASFNTTYVQPGAKQINLVVVSSSGIIDKNFDLLDIE